MLVKAVLSLCHCPAPPLFSKLVDGPGPYLLLINTQGAHCH
jgi:hypothetical protein